MLHLIYLLKRCVSEYVTKGCNASNVDKWHVFGNLFCLETRCMLKQQSLTKIKAKRELSKKLTLVLFQEIMSTETNIGAIKTVGKTATRTIKKSFH